MKKLVLILVLTITVAAGVVSAQDNGTLESSENETDTVVAELNDNLYVTDYWYNNGTFYVTVENTRLYQTVTLVEGRGLPEDGGVVEPNKKTVDLRRGEKTIPLQVSPAGGRAGVWLSAGSETRGIAVSTGDPLVGGPWTSEDVQLAGVAGTVSGILLMSFIGWRKKESVETEPNRVI